MIKQKPLILFNAKVLFVSLIFFVFLNSFSFGQSITWQRVLNNNYGAIEKAQQTLDGGYIAVGNDRINNEYKIYLSKFDTYGTTLWTKIIGIGYADGYWIEETFDNGFIIGGDSDSAIGNSKVYLVKTDQNGNILWQKYYANSGLDQCYCVKQTPDGGYILSCRTTPAAADMVMFIKTDSLGSLIWKKVYGNGTVTLAIREIQVLSNGYITSGNLGLQNSADAYLMRLDLNGDSLWTKKYGGSKADGLYSIDKVGAVGFILGGVSQSFNINNKSESYAMMIDTGGNMLWQKTYGGFEFDVCRSVKYKQNSGFVMVGYSDSVSGSDIRAKIRILNNNGDVLRENSFLPVSYPSSALNSINLTNDGGYITAGYVHTSNNALLMYIIKTDSVLGANLIGINSNTQVVPENYIVHQNYPNPFNPTTMINFEISKDADVSIKIYDILGKEVFGFNEFKSAGSYEVQFDGTNFASGMYFYKLEANGFVDTKKMVLLK